jgi:hypothetical protein
LGFDDGQKAIVEVNWQGCGRETLMEKLRPYCPAAEDENKVEAKLPDPPAGGSGEQGKDSEKE